MARAPLSVDVCDLAWGPVTVRVAWTLLQRGVAVRPEILTDARDHVWYHLPPDLSVADAEDRAERLTTELVDRASNQAKPDPWPEDAELRLPQRWRNRLHGSVAPLAGWVLRLHYADGLDLDRVAWRTGEDRLAVEAAREGLREVVRRVAADDGFPLDAWPEARLDRLIHRLACLPPDDGPPLMEVVEGKHPDAAAGHVRAARALALARQGLIRYADLVPPPGGGRPVQELTLVALQFDREARVHRAAVAREARGVRIPLGDDTLLLDGHDLPAVQDLLVLATQVGAPRREHLRGVVLRGHGRMSRHGVLGPLADGVERAVRAVPFGGVDGLEELPEMLPRPPSAWPMWAGVGALALATALILRAAWQPLVPPVVHPLVAEATPGRGGVWVAFDVDDEADVVIVRQVGQALEPVLDSYTPSDKLRLATGDGSYRTHTVADGVLIASLSEPVDDLRVLLARAQQAAHPLDALAAELRRAQRGSDVWTWRP
jgi:hypothetical protein